MGINQKDDLIETLLKFNKPLSRKKDTMLEFLNKHYSDYISSLRTLKYNSKNIGSKKLYEQISDSISDIEDTGKTCINVLDLYGQANIKDAVCVCQSKSLAFGLEKLCTCQHNFVH